MQDFATILQAIASLLWPAFAFTALFIFRPHVADLVKRLRKGKFFGQELELAESLDRLEKRVESSQQEPAVAISGPSTPDLSSETEASVYGVIREILAESSRSPRVALIMLAIEIEKHARELLATMGYLRGRRYVPIQQTIEELTRERALPAFLPDSLRDFWAVRNRLIHGEQGTDEDVVRALDSGITILKTLEAIPRQTNIVHDPNVVVYSSPDLITPLQGIRGVTLELRSPGGASKQYVTYLTTRTHYMKGKRVEWGWITERKPTPAWYRDPDTGAAKEVMASSWEFIGRHIDELGTGSTP